MIFLKKFYADDAAEAVAPAIDVAAMLAKSGSRTEEGGSTEIPDIKIEEPKPKMAEGIKPEVSAETVPTPAKPEARVEVPQIPSPAGEVVQPPLVDWKTELKKADVAEILKELGFDPKMVGFYNKWRTDGNITDYLKAVTVDFSKMTPEQLMKYQMQEDYPELSPEDLEELYRARVIEQYKLDPDTFSEMEIKRGRILIGADAKKIRETLMAKQQEYILSAKPPAAAPDTSVQDRQQEEAIQQVLSQYKTTLEAHPVTKELITNKRLLIGEGEDSFIYELPDAAKALTALQNPQQWAELVFNPDGSPKVELQLFLSAAAIDEKLPSHILKAGMALGAKRAIEQIENAKKPDAAPSKPDDPTSPAQALARAGVITNG